MVHAATELFSERGYAGTSIGKIEERAGLAPRAGGFYRHFRSKDELLEAVLDAEIDTPENTGAVASFDLGDTRAELIAIGRAYLAMILSACWSVKLPEHRAYEPRARPPTKKRQP